MKINWGIFLGRKRLQINYSHLQIIEISPKNTSRKLIAKWMIYLPLVSTPENVKTLFEIWKSFTHQFHLHKWMECQNLYFFVFSFLSIAFRDDMFYDIVKKCLTLAREKIYRATHPFPPSPRSNTFVFFINIIRISEYSRVPVWQMNYCQFASSEGHLERNRRFTLSNKLPRVTWQYREIFFWRYHYA